MQSKRRNQGGGTVKQDDDEVVRFWIEADFSSEPDESAFQGYPESHEEAIRIFEYLNSRYPCVWLAEYGKYKAGNEWKDAWMYYRWTDATYYGDCKGRFTGYPDGDDPLSDYVAIYRDGSRVPGV
jgi:hypothetical protein